MTLSILDAAYHTVHQYPGGAEALAGRLRPAKSSVTLCHEVRPPVGSSAKLGAETAAQLVDLSGDDSIAHAFCARLGGMFVRLPEPGDQCPRSVFETVSSLAKEFSDVVSAISHSASDGDITLNQMRQIEQEAVELMAALQVTLRAVREMHEGR